jgi:hypothetical protein
MTEASRYLVALAARIAAAYVAHTAPRAILLTGSAAAGTSDYYSDLDLIAYYDRLPTDDQLAAARGLLRVAGFRAASDRSKEWSEEEYVLQGVECQVTHFTIASWEGYWATVLEELTPGTGVQKAIIGLLDGVALHGDDLIGPWRARLAAYPEGLARAMVEHHLRFFPLWEVQARVAARDATLWTHQVLVESGQNILGVLAGLNRLYYSTFQFKRARKFIAGMRVAPENLADRLDGLFRVDDATAVAELERLVGETVGLVEQHMPEVDTSAVRRRLGARERPWTPAPLQEP